MLYACRMLYDSKPTPFLEVIVHRIQPLPGLTGLCIGYEQGEWRYRRFIEHLFHWLPEFALNYRELQNFNHANWLDQIVQAAKSVYTSSAYQGRGELGELLLHVAMREIFDTIPAISKIYFKDANNDTVKGFDAVHVVWYKETGELESWLGEVKFYKDIRSAIRDVVREIHTHCERDYLRREFAAIVRKVDPSFPYQAQLTKLLDPNVSLDKIFTRLRVPVLLTYESPTVAAHTISSEEYKGSVGNEFKQHFDTFAGSALPPQLAVHLFLFPMSGKDQLQRRFDERLKGIQG